ncbi:MAG TPA: hypothetical protein VE818_04070, partial [Nitrososphaeraceae archaeon]|nr:hypothetical protein [Nitrososphaeraceae archaeon]
EDNDIGAGTVSAIIKDTKQKDIPDIDLLREVALLLKNKDLDLVVLADSIRLKKKLDDMDLSEDQIESLIETCSIGSVAESIYLYFSFFMFKKACNYLEVLGLIYMCVWEYNYSLFFISSSTIRRTTGNSARNSQKYIRRDGRTICFLASCKYF